MNNTNYSDDSADTSNNDIYILIGIIVNVVLQIIMCGERAFKRVESSSCRKSADGSVEMNMKASRETP